ncbi:geranylgeranyl pyrophosphate synthetase [Tulasnella sp. 330]|nr:geranylgeranyl pyrophosphate synthetase [Tulasnella sp. 330]
MASRLDIYDNLMEKLSTPLDWSRSNEATLIEPFAYISSVKGKDIRGQMIEAFNCWLHVPEDKLAVISRVVGMLHNASLLMDDVEDDSQLRRGIPVAHKIYGIPQTINTANYVYFLAYQELFKLREKEQLDQDHMIPKQELDRIVTEELMNLHRGQGLDLFWRDSLTCPTEEEYIGMVNNKTGGLFRLAIKLMMANSKSDIDYVPLVNLIGVYFQIRDDYQNLQSTKANVLSKRPATPTMKRYAINYMDEHTESFRYTEGVMARLDKQARDEVARLGGNSQLEVILDMLRVTLPEHSCSTSS